MSQLSIVQQVRSKYPTPLGASHAGFLLEVSRALGMGLLRKSGGTTVTLPDGVTVAQDIMMDRATSRIYDILGDAEGAATPSFGEAGGSPADPSRFYDSGAGPVVPVDPPPPPPPADTLTPRVSKLEEDLKTANEAIGRLNDFISVLTTQLAKVSSERLTVKGSTGRTLGHSHQISLEVSRG